MERWYGRDGVGVKQRWDGHSVITLHQHRALLGQIIAKTTTNTPPVNARPETAEATAKGSPRGEKA